MINEKNLLGLNEVAETCGVSKNVVSNWRIRDDNFPTPYQENKGGPIWKTEDILEYMKAKNAYFDVITSQTGYIRSFRIAFIGRARDGKSYIVSRFAKNRTEYIELFCGGGKDETICVVNNYISESYQFDFLEFHTNFNSIYTEKDFKKNDEIRLIREEISEYVNSKIELEDPEFARTKIEKIKALIRRMRIVEEKYDGRKNSKTYLSVYLQPSEYAKNVMRNSRLGVLELVDTPGVSGDVVASDIEKSDLYVFVLKPDNREEAETLKRIVKSIKPYVATSKVIFLYKKEGYLLTLDKYEKASREAKEDMADFNDIFAELKGNIISTDLDLLDPAANCILYPTMDDEMVLLSEEQFMQELCAKICDTADADNTKLFSPREKEIAVSIGQKALPFIENILQGITKHTIKSGQNEYSTERFTAETHDRVMTNDGYRIRTSLGAAYRREAELLDKYFSQFKQEDYPEIWQQTLIKIVYRFLMYSTRTDSGLGVGTHPWEEKPARTMLVEESIFANQVLKRISGKQEYEMNEPYRKALQECGITSKTWDRVGCTNDEGSKEKLLIISRMENLPTVYCLEDFILIKYIAGLRKIAEYQLLKAFGADNDHAMTETLDFPF